MYSKSEGTVNNSSRGPLQPVQQLLRDTDARPRNSDGRLTNDRPHEVKAFVGYEIPKVDISVNATYRLLSGRTYAPFQRFGSSTINFSVTATTSAPAPAASRSSSRAAAGACRPSSVLDLRLEKVFSLGGASHRIAVFADFLNLTNEGTVIGRLSRVPTTAVPLPPPAELGETANVPFEAPSAIRAPRQIILGARG